MKVRSYIASSMKEYELKVKQDPVPADWSQLAKLTMTRLIMFNKQRRAEVKDLKVKQYTERPKWKDYSKGELDAALSAVDRMLAER